ncbi:hypothetical protein AVEN_133300-1 [Araneus ventricosus]|uniref:Uncharacterized protein n=1 Tax=Araneus ventricosus TaxID=182803 RepID=A0A4Y2DLF9_ARAVE|nr:hypothetical protein AVEN_133300-1 [Araneus ventricosus]
MNTMKEGTRLQLGDLFSLRMNHQEARQQQLPCLLKIRCLKRGKRVKKGETTKSTGGALPPSCLFVTPNSGNRNSERRTDVFWPRVSRKHRGWKGVPLVDRFAFYRAFVNLDISYRPSVFLISHPELSGCC